MTFHIVSLDNIKGATTHTQKKKKKLLTVNSSKPSIYGTLQIMDKSTREIVLLTLFSLCMCKLYNTTVYIQ